MHYRTPIADIYILSMKIKTYSVSYERARSLRVAHQLINGV